MEVFEIEKFTLAEVLCNIKKFTWSDALYLPVDQVWSKDTKGVVLDPDDVEDDEDDLPKYAKDHMLTYALSIQDIEGIVENAKGQKKECAIDDLVQAYLFYYDHDAFIDWM